MTKRVSGPQPMREAGSSGAAYPLLPPPSLPVGQWADSEQHVGQPLGLASGVLQGIFAWWWS